MRGPRPPHARPADYHVGVFIRDLALDTEVHAEALLNNDPTFEAQIYRLTTHHPPPRSLRLTIAHVPITNLRRLDETGRFVSIANRPVLIYGMEATWPQALATARSLLTGEHGTYTAPGTWTPR